MSIIFKTDKRRIIPIWKSLEMSASSGELDAHQHVQNPIKFDTATYILEQKKAWTLNQDLPHAGDLLSSAYVLGLESEFPNIAKFILDKDSNENSPLRKMAAKILKVNETESNIYDDTSNEIDRYRQQVGKYRHYLKMEPKNPIAWMEIGRYYSLLGKIDKAKQCIDSALFLDKNNRFITRSASRFYHHFQTDKDRPLNIIKKSEFVKVDPWLISAEIAYSSILGRYSKLAKVGAEMLKKSSVDYFATTELASALGTLEYSDGSLKNARRYFEQSLIDPNDNSLAQVSWMADDIQGLNIDNAKYDLPLAFEARAHHLYDEGNFEKSLDYSIKWSRLEPYSSRPIRLASYIASFLLNNSDLGVELLRKGIVINPNDLMLNNDLIYHLIKKNNVDEARKIYEKVIKGRLNNEDKSISLTVIATTGLLLYRTGNISEARRCYQTAISLAKNINNKYLLALALLNYADEEIQVFDNEVELNSIMNQVRDACKNVNEPDVNILYKKILDRFNNLKNVVKNKII